MNITEQIKTSLKAKKIKQKHLVKCLKMSESNVSNLLAGRITLNLSHLEALCKQMDIEIVITNRGVKLRDKQPIRVNSETD